MNIIKLKDIIMPNECRHANFFNKNLKGKYAYWVQMRYIFPLESLNFKQYIQFEQLDFEDFLSEEMLPHIDLYDEDCNMFNFAQDYVDQDTTESINNINEYLIANEYVVDYNVDINTLKKFRTWLANEILLLNSNVNGEYSNILSENVIHMLEFYKNDMYDDVVKKLAIFGVENGFSIENTSSNNCSCCNSTNSLLNNLSLPTVCKPIEIYTKNLHNLMVQTFENVNFWSELNIDFLKLFKLYIDNIIKAGFVFSNNENVLYVNCNCGDNNKNNITILQNLSVSLEYIINNDINNHKNFIYDSLHNWAEKLYDKMYWK